MAERINFQNFYLALQKELCVWSDLFLRWLNVGGKIRSRHFSGGTNGRLFWGLEGVKNREGGRESPWDRLSPWDSSAGRDRAGRNGCAQNAN